MQSHQRGWLLVNAMHRYGHQLSAAAGLAVRSCHKEAKPVAPPAPGTVNPYTQHIFIQMAPLHSDAEAKVLAQQHEGIWWPSVVERHPAMVQAFAAVAKLKAALDGVVKVTAYEDLQRQTLQEAGSDVADLKLFPAAVQYESIPVLRLGEIVTAHLQPQPPSEGHDASTPQVHLPPDLLRRQRDIEGVDLFVCCHGARDQRCGTRGLALAHRLGALVEQQGLGEHVRVHKCSHIGGHKYAGNVLVYGAMHPCDGDWFGGVNAGNAKKFLEALRTAEVGSPGGPELEPLRSWWRGRMGLDKEAQLSFFADPGCQYCQSDDAGVEYEADPELDVAAVAQAKQERGESAEATPPSGLVQEGLKSQAITTADERRAWQSAEQELVEGSEAYEEQEQEALQEGSLEAADVDDLNEQFEGLATPQDEVEAGTSPSVIPAQARQADPPVHFEDPSGASSDSNSSSESNSSSDSSSDEDAEPIKPWNE